jgi:hypothetical protein
MYNMGKVILKISPSLTSVSDSNMFRWFTFEKELEAGDTVGSLLETAVADHAGIRRRIFNPVTYQLNSEILVVLNDNLMRLPDVTQVILNAGDTITLLAMDIGG